MLYVHGELDLAKHYYYLCSLCLFTKIDKDFLKIFGGFEKKSFINILDSEYDKHEYIHQPQIGRHSAYYDYEYLIPILCKNKNNFSTFSTNIQSINAKIDQLNILVESLRQQHFSFSAICEWESWLSQHSDVSQIQ